MDFIGLNGAGKSTTIKTIIGQLDPFSGRGKRNLVSSKTNVATVNSLRLFQESPEVLYEELTFREHIECRLVRTTKMNEETNWLIAMNL